MSLLQPQDTPPPARATLRYQRVIDLVEELIATRGLGPGSFVFSISGQTARRLFRPADLNDWGATPVRGSRPE